MLPPRSPGRRRAAAFIALGALVAAAPASPAEAQPAAVVADSVRVVTTTWRGRDSAVAVQRYTASVPGIVPTPGGASNGPPPPSVPPPGTPALPPVVPALPRLTVDTRMPVATGRTLRVPAGASLQAALDSARGGDVVALAAGATFTGNFRLKPRGDTGWVVVRTDAPDSLLPPPGTRLSPTRHGAALARLVSPNADAALRTLNGARGWRLVGLEVTHAPAVKVSSTILNFGPNSTEFTTAAALPRDLILDRSWVHGTGALQVKRCVALNGGSSAVVDSYLSECHAKGQDSQAIVGWSGTGPYRIENNYLEGAGENLMFGGAAPYIQGVTPADIVIRRNHFYKPEAWRGVWTVKNVLELKFAQRVLIEENVLENNWMDAQTGFALLLKTSTDAKATWVVTEDVTIRRNVVRHSPAGIAIAANPDTLATPARRILVEGNLFEQIGTANGTTNGRMVQLSDDLSDVAFVRNTMVPNTVTEGLTLVLAGRKLGRNLVLAGNIFRRAAYGISGDGRGSGPAAFPAHWESFAVAGNVFAEFRPAEVPPGNWTPAPLAAVGFLNPGAGDWRVAPGSPYAGTGADAAALAAIAAAVAAR